MRMHMVDGTLMLPVNWCLHGGLRGSQKPQLCQLKEGKKSILMVPRMALMLVLVTDLFLQ
jgi:hypothetical protein